MPRTWSNRKITQPAIPVGQARTKKPVATTFLVLMGIIIVFFSSLMTYVTVSLLVHPPPETNENGR